MENLIRKGVRKKKGWWCYCLLFVFTSHFVHLQELKYPGRKVYCCLVKLLELTINENEAGMVQFHWLRSHSSLLFYSREAENIWDSKLSAQGEGQSASKLVPSDIGDGSTVICLTGVFQSFDNKSFMKGDFFLICIFVTWESKGIFSYHLYDSPRQQCLLQKHNAYNLNLGKRFINVPKAN